MGFTLIPTGNNIINDERLHTYEVTNRVCALVFEGFVHAAWCSCVDVLEQLQTLLTVTPKCAESSGLAGELLRIWSNSSDQLYH